MEAEFPPPFVWDAPYLCVTIEYQLTLCVSVCLCACMHVLILYIHRNKSLCTYIIL